MVKAASQEAIERLRAAIQPELEAGILNQMREGLLKEAAGLLSQGRVLEAAITERFAPPSEEDGLVETEEETSERTQNILSITQEIKQGEGRLDVLAWQIDKLDERLSELTPKDKGKGNRAQRRQKRG